MELLKKSLISMNLSSDDEIINSFQKYMELVLDWNQKVNLTAITEKDDFIKKHFIDSIACINSDEFKNAKHIIDIGTGAGFPGLPLAILCREKKFVLLDSLNKRIKILNDIINELGLTNVEAIHGRAEELAHKKEYREKFDIVVSRAVSRLSVLSELSIPFLKKNGYFISYKGPYVQDEINDAKNALKMLNSEFIRIEYDKNEFNHCLVYINKKSLNEKKYPRKPGTPKRLPL